MTIGPVVRAGTGGTARAGPPVQPPSAAETAARARGADTAPTRVRIAAAGEIRSVCRARTSSGPTCPTVSGSAMPMA